MAWKLKPISETETGVWKTSGRGSEFWKRARHIPDTPAVPKTKKPSVPRLGKKRRHTAMVQGHSFKNKMIANAKFMNGIQKPKREIRRASAPNAFAAQKSRRCSILSTCNLAGTRSRNVSGLWTMTELSQDALTFSVTELITSKGERRAGPKIRDRYLEILKFPDSKGPGRGKYFLKGAQHSYFQFSGGEKGVFDAKQANGRPFHLEPLIDDEDRPVGFVWRFPDEYPKFRVEFGLSEAARKAVANLRMDKKSSSAFGQFEGKFNKPGTERQNTGATAFEAWQKRFQVTRKGMKLTVDPEKSTLNIVHNPDGTIEVTVSRKEE